MNTEIMSIINRLKCEKITTKKAIKLIKNLNYTTEPKHKCSKLKITIYDKSDNKTIKIPAIPFWLITALGRAGLSITKYVSSKTDNLDDETKQYLYILDDLNLKELLNELKNHEPYDLVNVEEKDGDMVKISVL